MAYGDPRPDEGSDNDTDPTKPKHWMEDRSWVNDEDLAALNLEREAHPGESEVALANRLLRDALPFAIQSVSRLAVHSPIDRIRLEAAKYIIERNLGKVTDTGSVTQVAAWEELLADAVVDR